MTNSLFHFSYSLDHSGERTIVIGSDKKKIEKERRRISTYLRKEDGAITEITEFKGDALVLNIDSRVEIQRCN